MSVRSVAFALMTCSALAIAGCSSGSGSTPAPTSPAPGSSSSSVAPPAATPEPPTPVASSPSSSQPVVAVQSHGPSSKECAAASQVLANATKVGALASQGKMTQAEFEAAYAGTVSEGLPTDALGLFADLKTASSLVIDKDVAAAGEYLGQFSSALAAFVSATETICS